jgi:hypothetical protein
LHLLGPSVSAVLLTGVQTVLDGIMHLGRLCVPFELGNRTVNVSVGKVLADYREVEAYIVSMRRNPIEVMRQAADMPGQVIQLVVSEAVRVASAPTFVRGDEYDSFRASPHGMAYEAWRALRDNEEDFGMIPQGEKRRCVYKAPSGVTYSLTPEQGVQKVLDVIETAGRLAFDQLVAIARMSSQDVVLGNSTGPTETQGQTTAPEM